MAQAERHIGELERRIEVLLAIVTEAGFQPEEVRVSGRLEWVLVPTDPGALLRAALAAWEISMEDDGDEQGEEEWSRPGIPKRSSSRLGEDGLMSEQAPPFGTWILTEAVVSEALGNVIAKASEDPNWPRYGDYWAVERYLNPHRSGAGIGGVDHAYQQYKKQFPDA